MDNLQFIKEISWPIVALFCAYYLLHKGLLKDIFQIISDKIIDIGKTLNSMKDVSEKMKNSADTLRDATNDLSSKLDTVLNKVTQIKRNTDGISVAIESNDEQEYDYRNEEKDLIYKNLMDEWDAFVATMRESFTRKNDFDAISIGRMAKLLTDNEYTSRIISNDDAEKIIMLFSKIKGARRNWSSRENKEQSATNIIKDIRDAITIIRKS